MFAFGVELLSVPHLVIGRDLRKCPALLLASYRASSARSIQTPVLPIQDAEFSGHRAHVLASVALQLRIPLGSYPQCPACFVSWLDLVLVLDNYLLRDETITTYEAVL